MKELDDIQIKKLEKEFINGFPNLKKDFHNCINESNITEALIYSEEFLIKMHFNKENKIIFDKITEYFKLNEIYEFNPLDSRTKKSNFYKVNLQELIGLLDYMYGYLNKVKKYKVKITDIFKKYFEHVFHIQNYEDFIIAREFNYMEWRHKYNNYIYMDETKF